MTSATPFEVIWKHFDPPTLVNNLVEQRLPWRAFSVNDGHVVFQAAICLPCIALMYLRNI